MCGAGEECASYTSIGGTHNINRERAENLRPRGQTYGYMFTVPLRGKERTDSQSGDRTAPIQGLRLSRMREANPI